MHINEKKDFLIEGKRNTATGILPACISICAANKQIDSGGFIWTYLNGNGEPMNDVAERVKKVEYKSVYLNSENKKIFKTLNGYNLMRILGVK